MVSIKLVNLHKRFGNVLTLPEVNLEIQDKEFMVLVGPSGCGKSTTLNLIAGLEYATDGAIYFDDQEVTYLPPKERKVAMVFQSYALYPHMNVYDNMSFGLKLAKMPKDEIDQRIKNAAKILEIEELLDRKPKDMSGGQRQRVALGRAVVRDPTVFLFDEPLSNLDAKLRVQTRGEIIKLHKRLKTTLIYVTHDQVEAMSMADRICILDKGNIQQVGTPSEVYDTPANMFVAGFIGSPAMNFIKGTYDPSNQRFSFGQFKYEIPSTIVNSLSDIKSEQELILGIRPEDVKIGSDGFPMEVSVIEFLGADTLLTLEVPSESLILLCMIDGHFEGNIGDQLNVSWSEKKVHFFDTTSEINLVHR